MYAIRSYYVYTISKDKYLIDFNINFNGVNNTIASNMGYLTLEWQSYINSFEKGKKWELQNSSIFYKYDSDESAESLSMRSNNASENLTTKVKWISYKQQFFNTTRITSYNVCYTKLLREKMVTILPKVY